MALEGEICKQTAEKLDLRHQLTDALGKSKQEIARSKQLERHLREARHAGR